LTKVINKIDNKSSPPYKGGVPEGRGGSPVVITVLPINERIHVNNLPELRTFRTDLRKRMTPAEATFWRIVKNSKLDGLKFRRQHSVGRYVLDFYCPSEKLAVELDGAVHFGPHSVLHDHERKLFLQFFGIKVIRFENKLVFDELQLVLDRIRAARGWRDRAEGVI
jgi:very-short-patch-repair endonuclease